MAPVVAIWDNWLSIDREQREVPEMGSFFRGLSGPLILFAAVAICTLFARQLEPLLVYDRALANQGELWRLLSAHLTHTNLQHLMLNLSGLALLVVLHGPHYRTLAFLAATTVTALVTGIGLHLFSPDTSVYLGLSGVLHGLIIWGGCMDIRARWRTGYLLVLGTWIKIALEQWYGASGETAQLIDADVAVDAHLWGAIAGSLLGLGVLLPVWRGHGKSGVSAAAS